MLILKTDHTAYGLGSGAVDNVFTINHRQRRYAKPVKLMENVKHVYASLGKSLFLTRKNELYWTGTVDFDYFYYEWAEGKEWKLPALYGDGSWSSALAKKIGINMF